MENLESHDNKVYHIPFRDMINLCDGLTCKDCSFEAQGYCILHLKIFDADKRYLEDHGKSDDDLR